MVTEQDLADVIAGHFQTSRAHAYELMEKALLERGYAHGKTDTQTAVAAEGDRYTREIERLRGVLVAIDRHSVATLRTNSKDRGDWAEDMAFVGKLARGH